MKLTYPRWTAALAGALIGVAAQAADTVVTFDHGDTQGFVGIDGATKIAWLRGNDRPALRTTIENFDVHWGTDSNQSFVGDLSGYDALTLSIDVDAYKITFDGKGVTRELIVELRDYDNPENGLPYTSVWYDLGTLTPRSGWQTYAVTIDDPASTALPSGWGGYGAEDPSTGMPELPADRTFASVLAGVDEVVFTTAEPGYFYGFTQFDIAVDNIAIHTVSAVPEPSTAALALAGLAGMVTWRRRSAKAKAATGLPATA